MPRGYIPKAVPSRKSRVLAAAARAIRRWIERLTGVIDRIPAARSISPKKKPLFADRTAFRSPALGALGFGFCSIALAGCFLLDSGPKGDSFFKENPIDAAILDSPIGNPAAVAGRIRDNVLHLAAPGPTMDAIEAVATKHGATCRRVEENLRCDRVKVLRHGSKGAGQLAEHRIELVVSPRSRGAAALAVCVDIMPDELNPHKRSCVGDPPD